MDWSLEFDDIGVEVRKRMAVMCHIFGGLTPMNIWTMGYRDFRDMASFADAWAKAQKEG